MSFWDDKNFLYPQMTVHHKPLFEFVTKFIEENGISSVLEVGGGKNPINKFVDDLNYTGIDLNSSLPEMLHEDFTTMELDHYADTFDLFLALSVVEHCDGYKKFLSQIRTLNPQYAMVSFFNKLKRKDDLIIKKQKYGGEYFVNRYSKAKIEEYLKELDIDNYNFVSVGKDEVLVICFYQ